MWGQNTQGPKPEPKTKINKEILHQMHVTHEAVGNLIDRATTALHYYDALGTKKHTELGSIFAGAMNDLCRARNWATKIRVPASADELEDQLKTDAAGKAAEAKADAQAGAEADAKERKGK